MLLKQWTHILKFSVLQSKDGQFFPVIDIKKTIGKYCSKYQITTDVDNVSIVITWINVIEKTLKM